MRYLRLRTVLPSKLRLAGAALLAMLFGGMACDSGSAISNRLAERLREITDLGRPNASPDDIEKALAQQLRVAPIPAKGNNRPSSPTFPTRQTLRKFYANRGRRLAWCDHSGDVLPGASTFLQALRRAGEHGLDPEDYGLSRLERMGNEMREARSGKTAVTRWPTSICS